MPPGGAIADAASASWPVRRYGQGCRVLAHAGSWSNERVLCFSGRPSVVRAQQRHPVRTLAGSRVAINHDRRHGRLAAFYCAPARKPRRQTNIGSPVCIGGCAYGNLMALWQTWPARPICAPPLAAVRRPNRQATGRSTKEQESFSRAPDNTGIRRSRSKRRSRSPISCMILSASKLPAPRGAHLFQAGLNWPGTTHTCAPHAAAIRRPVVPARAERKDHAHLPETPAEVQCRH